MTGIELRPQVVVGRGDGDHLSIRVLGRLHAGADDYWDGNWLVTPIDVVAGGFRGESGAALRAEELVAFREALERVYQSLDGEAVLESIESWLTLRVAVDRSGRLTVTGCMLDRLGSANKLDFKIEGLDQSDLSLVIEGLQEIETFFPVVGVRRDR
jgi:hypothetical protein